MSRPIDLQFRFDSNLSGDWEYEFLGLQSIPKIIGLTGATKSGKTMIAKRLATEYGFYYVNLGSILSKIASIIGETDLTWKNLGLIGKKLKKSRGRDILSRLAFRIIQNQPTLPDKIIIDSFLHPEEIEFFLKRSNLVLIGIEMNHEVRLQHLMSWSEDNEETAQTMLAERDEIEQYQVSNGDPYAPNVGECLKLIKDPERLIRIDSKMTAVTVYDPIDKLMDKLSQEWELKRQTAPVSSNNYPYWNQKI